MKRLGHRQRGQGIVDSVEQQAVADVAYGPRSGYGHRGRERGPDVGLRHHRARQLREKSGRRQGVGVGEAHESGVEPGRAESFDHGVELAGAPPRKRTGDHHARAGRRGVHEASHHRVGRVARFVEDEDSIESAGIPLGERGPYVRGQAGIEPADRTHHDQRRKRRQPPRAVTPGPVYRVPEDDRGRGSEPLQHRDDPGKDGNHGR